MQIYSWEETEHHFIAVVRPAELFDLSTLEEPPQAAREVELHAHNVVSGEMEVYAKAFTRDQSIAHLQKREHGAPETYAARDAEQLRQLHGEAGQPEPQPEDHEP